MGIELPNFVDNGSHDVRRMAMTMPMQCLDQPFLAEFLVLLVERLGDPVGVDREQVAGKELADPSGGLPFVEEADDRGRRTEAFDGAIGAEDQSG